MKNDDPDSAEVVGIDEHALDKECIKLPTHFLHYSTAACEAKRDADELKAELSVLEADLGKRIRDMPGKFGMEKATEKSVADAIILQDEHQALSRKLARARYNQDLAQAVVNALEHKKRSLTLLVELHGLGYFSSPKMSEKGREAVREMTKKAVYRRHTDD